MSPRGKILVTGASGFVGSHIVDKLLRDGYAVKGVCRSPKAEQLRKNCVDPQFEVTVVDDLIAGDFSEALRDVTGVIHVASPMNGTQDTSEVATGGTMNIIRQAYAAQIYKIVLMGSFVTAATTPELNDSSLEVTDKDWRKMSKEAVHPDAYVWETYCDSKALAEQAAWEFAESHPELDLITLLPTFIYGPFASPHVVTGSSFAAISTNALIYQLIAQPTPSYPMLISPHGIDVRNVATAAVRALSPPAKGPQKLRRRQRRVFLQGGTFVWTDVVRHLARVRPALKDRLVEGGNPSTDQGDATAAARFDMTAAKEELGMESYISWQQMVEDTVDSLLQREATWLN